MKHQNKILTGAVFLGLTLITSNFAFAQTAVRETTITTTTAGTISEFGPEMFLIRSAASPDLVRYSYSKTTTYVDENGEPVAVAMVKSGLPVTVYYTKDGDKMIATKVVVRKGIKEEAPLVETKKITTTTTTNTAGTVTEFGDNTIIMRSESSPDPVTYSYSKTTTYVDENGEAVAIKTVKSGLPVTVYYTMDGDKMIATKVVVRKAAK